MAEEDDRLESRSDSGSEDDYEEGEEIYDDEGTLDEEEMLENDDDYQDELKILQDDAELPVEELRKRYYGNSGVEDEYRSSDEAQSTSTYGENPVSETHADSSDAVIDTSRTPSEVAGPSNKSRFKNESHGYFSDVEDTEEDADYVPPDPWRREVRKGPIYQADVPDFPSFNSDITNSDRGNLLWSPAYGLPEAEIDNFLTEFYKLAFQNSASANAEDMSRFQEFVEGQIIKDDENALKVLMEANYDIKEALSRFPFANANAPKISTPLSPSKWTEEECQLFEDGMRLCGKNFVAIRRMKLPHRTVGELVHFYYIWKKTERHDMFIEHGKYQERSNCTDYMGRLISHIDATAGDAVEHLTESLDLSTPSLPANLDLMGAKGWNDCWQQEADGSLPHIDNDTIANVLQ